jgi:hypothetical protein
VLRLMMLCREGVGSARELEGEVLRLWPATAARNLMRRHCRTAIWREHRSGRARGRLQQSRLELVKLIF